MNRRSTHGALPNRSLLNSPQLVAQDNTRRLQPALSRRWTRETTDFRESSSCGCNWFHFSLRIQLKGRLLRDCFNLLQDVHHQVFPEPSGLRPSVENKPEPCRSCLKVRQHANVRKIIAQPMAHGLHLFHAVGSDANGVRQDPIQVDATGKPLLEPGIPRTSDK